MRQIKRFPANKSYKFGLGIPERFGGLEVKNGDFITEEDVKKYEVGEKFLEKVGEERKNWEDEIPKNTDIIVFNIKTIISGGDEFEKQRMIDGFEAEFKDYIRQKGTIILKVINVQVIKKRIINIDIGIKVIEKKKKKSKRK